MSASEDRCPWSGHVAAGALDALPMDEHAAVQAHLADCAACRQESSELRAVASRFDAWPADVLRPSALLIERLAQRLAMESGGPAPLPPRERWAEPEWEPVARGIECKLLATDRQRRRVSMLVRLAPGAEYPPHRHAGVEELHLLDGELWIDERRLRPGDYNRALPGSGDKRVWSETGCTCVLVTSSDDVLG